MSAPVNIIKGSLYAIVGFFFMAVFGLFSKFALQSTSIVWVSFIAYLTGTLVLIPYIARKGSGYLKSEHYSFLIGRAVFGTLASFLYTISIKYIPLVNGTLLFNTAPIFIPILAYLFLKTTIQKYIQLAIAIGFVGIIVIIKPTEAIFTQTGNLIALGSGLSLAIAYLLMKLLTVTDPGIRIIFYYLGIGTLIQLPLLFFEGSVPGVGGLSFAALSGIVLVVAQLALVNGYKYAEASQIGVYQYSSVVYVAFLDWLFWGVTISRQEILGIIIVTLAGIVIIRYNNNKN